MHGRVPRAGERGGSRTADGGSHAGHRRTKIIGTIGPASDSVTTLTRLARAGMDVARLNFSHGTYAHHRKLIRNVRAAARRAGKTIGILQDLQGPKIRVGELPPGGVPLRRGAPVILSTALSAVRGDAIPVQYRRLHSDVRRGDRLLLADGLLELRVERVRGRAIHTHVVVGGVLKSHKGINVPTATLSASPLTARDRADLGVGLKEEVDFVALSFVRRAADVRQLRKLIAAGLPRGRTPPQVVVKVERREALENLAAIVAEADGVMIARGDLALEADPARVPLVQKMIIRQCLAAAKPVITATEMLASMEERPRPTRAEIADVANAVLDGTDATMLSGESAVGKYPVETVATMAHVLRDTEASALDRGRAPVTLPEKSAPVLAVSIAACRLAADVGAAAIVAVTQSGFTARAISRHRPPQPILAVTFDAAVARQLTVSAGVTPLAWNGARTAARLRSFALRALRAHRLARRGDRVILVQGLRADHAPRWEEAVRVVTG